MLALWLMFWSYSNVQKEKCLPDTLLVLITLSLYGIIYCEKMKVFLSISPK